jgi:hypothetical protein
MSMGYSSETARMALQQSNNNVSLSVQLIQDQPGLLNVACTSKFKVKKEMLQQVWFCLEEHKFWYIPYNLESNPHRFYSFRGLKNQMRIIITYGLDLWLRAGFWKDDGTAVHAIRKIQYNNLLFYLLLIILIYYQIRRHHS